ncbi:unnamed protein product [Hymenolepis diminuta]|uniref:Fibronectin type-III domain-containing protein n=1 Tax=Hymenolepis diminuta TaxID=6216 RepID=A0A0R3SNP3_HYMDI|nr:unnamed protein product [Hymenolepis diminuta]
MQVSAPEGLPDPPKNVQVEAGPQDGVLLVSWRPVPQATHVLPNFENEPLVHGYSVCINDQPLIDVPGVDRKWLPNSLLLSGLVVICNNTGIAQIWFCVC